jgi:predicted TIM-barrel fold metal-dependent hydrolase
MKRIDFEAHFLTREYVKVLSKNKGYPRYVEDEQTKSRQWFYTADAGLQLGDFLLDRLLDLGEGRLKIMDEAGVDVQVLSLTAPGLEQLDPGTGTSLAKKTNNALAEVIQKHPDRFLGFAALAPQNPEGASDELERAVKDLGFKGWNTHSNYGGTYLDDKKYWPILEKAEQLDVLIYLHPTVPAIPQLGKYGFSLAGAPFGFGVEAGMCMMRLILSGVFDKYPRLKIMLGHYGEALPFLMTRIDWPYTKPSDPARRPTLARKPSEYLKNNVVVTTSGNFFEPAFMCTYQAMGIDKIFLGTDHPYESMDESIQFLEGLPISQEEKDKIYYLNANRIGFTV